MISPKIHHTSLRQKKKIKQKTLLFINFQSNITIPIVITILVI